MDSSEPQILATEADPDDAFAPGDDGVLHGFYQHLGTVACGASEAGQIGAEGWMRSLTEAGHADLADAWENLGLLSESPEALADGLLELTWKVGEKLRAVHEPARSLEEALSGWEHEDVEEPAGELDEQEAMREHDVRRLVNLLRVGDFVEKREAALSLGDFLLRKRKLASEEHYRLALEALISNRDPAVALEATESLAQLGGSEARRAKVVVERMDAFFDKISDRIRHYWDGASQDDPLDELSDPDLVSMGIWMRRAPDHIAGHVAEYMLARLGRNETGALASVTSAVVPSGDPRLLPVLIRVLQDAGYEARVASIKAIAHIDDPRSLGALRKDLRHATDALERVMIARALANFGDHSGREDLLTRLDESSPSFVREEALKAVGRLPDVEPAVMEKIEALVESPASAIALAALRALSLKGDADTVERLERLAAERVTLRAAANRAAGDLRARLALAGDERFVGAGSDLALATIEKPGLVPRIRSVLWYLLGFVFAGLHQWQKARMAAGRASRINSSSAKGHFLTGYVWIQEGRDDAAIESYRHGLQIDSLFPVRQWGEADRLLGAYLRHAEVLERRLGRRDESIALLEETEFIDLRSADPNLKIEVDRRLDGLKLERRRERLQAEKE
ncbi:MAG: HEAT repeat domain-containing protein [Deltaproteobacteria bacterium]|nr:HEAT repeat domain-containing protein [Deltaproteobacteria bacterium]